jgi:hypothetical protein
MLDSVTVVADLLLQNGVNIDARPDGPFGLATGAVGAFLSTLLVGAILIAVVPDYTEAKIRTVFADPVESFLYGFLALVVLIVLIVALVLTIIGILFVIPLVLVAWLAWAVGATIAFVAIGDRLVGHHDGWLRPLVVGAGIGGLVSFVIGAIGFGAVLRDYA